MFMNIHQRSSLDELHLTRASIEFAHKISVTVVPMWVKMRALSQGVMKLSRLQIWLRVMTTLK